MATQPPTKLTFCPVCVQISVTLDPSHLHSPQQILRLTECWSLALLFPSARRCTFRMTVIKKPLNEQ